MAFIPNPENKPEVNHKDGVKHHNWGTNLEWATEKENGKHATDILKRRIGENYYNNALTEKQVLEIYELCKENKMLRKDIAKLYNITPECVREIANGHNWKYLNLQPLASTRGQNHKGSKYSRKRYKLFDTLTNEEFVFDKAKDIGKIIGLSDTTIRNYCKKEIYKEHLYNDRYLFESLDWIYKII